MFENWQLNPKQRKQIQLTKERYSTWNWVHKYYAQININQDINMFEEKVIISPCSLKLKAHESCITNGNTTGFFKLNKKRTDHNPTPIHKD
jgi:hypothetical protein